MDLFEFEASLVNGQGYIEKLCLRENKRRMHCQREQRQADKEQSFLHRVLYVGGQQKVWSRLEVDLLTSTSKDLY